MGKTELKIVATIDGVENTGSISDGYHTFDELYEHRIRLFISLCREHKRGGDALERNDEAEVSVEEAGFLPVWCSVYHSDGTSIEDWFVLGMGKKKGEQITYHLPARFWSEVCEFAQVLDKAPEWDGHQSNDVLERLKKL